ncbi:hypothetical protein ALC57_14974 [Trachymyrmex cornetzi]|uniref:Uncharacterized protein n=1 Tax=Trachymyrmex cornetzi TaxID=471704 RepID=A0A195DKA2_9HYME|nr:hypothetical protein ALC57_14974 [Trachymyrmex cornetzi]
MENFACGIDIVISNRCINDASSNAYPCELELFSLTTFFSVEAVTCCNGEGTGDECLLELESALTSSSSSVGNFDTFFLFNPGTLLSMTTPDENWNQQVLHVPVQKAVQLVLVAALDLAFLYIKHMQAIHDHNCISLLTL